jgi:serine/threonine-protein kinase
MGEVVLNLDHRIGRHVARKTLLREASTVRATALFVREVRVQGQLEHPSVVPVYDFGVGPNGAPYFTMKRVRGETLGHILERLADGDADYVARFSRHKLLAAFRQVCLAVEYAHTRGVVHRDLKPSNIMLGDFGEVYVLDWGLAKLRSDSTVLSAPSGADDRPSGPLDAERTSADDLVGTPAYMAPEQFGRAAHDFDTRQDVFALGAVLYEVLTLGRYRPGATFATLVHTLLREADRPAPPRPSEVAPHVAPELDDVCVRALASDPKARLGSAATIAEVIDRYLEGDRDLGARKALADSLLTSARARIARGGRDAAARVDAMREAIKALALTPDDVETQRFLLSLVVDGSGKLPPDAEHEFEVHDFELDATALRMSILGLSSWFLALPLAIAIGVLSWLPVAAMVALTLMTIVYIQLLIRWRSRATRHMLTMAGLLATTLALSSCWLGPFVLAPVATTAIAMLFASRCKARERLPLIVLWGTAVLAPFALELLHVLPPAYTFRAGEVVLHARALALPEGLTTAALAYTSLTFMVLPMIFVGQLRDKQRSGDRKLFVQAWHLRQLFPAASEPPPRT